MKKRSASLSDSDFLRLNSEQLRSESDGLSLTESEQKIPFREHEIKTTERKLSEEYLRQSEELYKSLFQDNQSAILLIDPDTGEIRDANQAACLYYGWSRHELIRKNITEINTLPPSDIAKKLSDSKKQINNHLFFQHRLANGEIRSVEVYSGPIKFREITLLYSIIHDITESKLTQDALLESELKFRKYVDHSPHGIFVANENGQYIEVNSAACSITGYSKEELLKKNLIELIPEEWIENARLHFGRVKTHGIATGESAFIKKDGSKRYWSVDAVKISEKVFLGFVVDVTGRKETEEALLKNERLLRESQAASHIGSYSVDLINKTWTASSEVYDIFGIDETYPQTLEAWEMRIHHDFRKELTEELVQDENRKNLFEHEYKIIRDSDGEHRWIHGIGEYEYEDDRNPVRLVGTIRDITRRRENEEALKLSNEKIRESENDLNKAESVAHLGHWKWNIQSGEITWSDEMYRIFGIEKDSYKGRLGDVISKVIHPEDIHLLLPENARNLADTHPVEYRIILPDNSIRYIAAESGENLFDNNGNPTYLTGIAQDITSRKQAEIELKHLNEELEDRVNERTSDLLKLNTILKEAEVKYRTVADHTHGWEFWLDKDENFIYCSPSCERITGFKASEFLNNPMRLFEIIHPDDLKSFLNHKKTEDLCQVGNHEFQYRIIRSDGAMRWIGHECQPIYDESGNFYGVRGSNRDITERKQMENLIKTSNQKYKLLSENISDGIFICRDGVIEYVNQAMNAIFGYEDREMDGLKLTQLVLPDYLDELEFINAIKFPINQTKSVEIECLKKDNSTVFVEFKFNFVAKERLLYGVAHDITEKKQIQKNIVKAIIQTEEKERSNFSKELHDGLGPLLSTIKLYLQWSERPKTNKSREEIIHKAEEILEDALTAVKEISNKLSPHLLTYYGLNSAIQSFVGKLEETSSLKIEFESNLSRRLDMEIEAAIYRALIECVNNTIKHSFAKYIVIMLNDTGDQIQVHYKDDGIGYDMGETFSNQKGLGLFNLQNRIQTIGGRIALFSKPGKGVDYQIVVNL